MPLFPPTDVLPSVPYRSLFISFRVIQESHDPVSLVRKGWSGFSTYLCDAQVSSQVLCRTISAQGDARILRELLRLCHSLGLCSSGFASFCSTLASLRGTLTSLRSSLASLRGPFTSSSTTSPRRRRGSLSRRLPTSRSTGFCSTFTSSRWSSSCPFLAGSSSSSCRARLIPRSPGSCVDEAFKGRGLAPRRRRRRRRLSLALSSSGCTIRCGCARSLCTSCSALFGTTATQRQASWEDETAITANADLTLDDNGLRDGRRSTPLDVRSYLARETALDEKKEKKVSNFIAWWKKPVVWEIMLVCGLYVL